MSDRGKASLSRDENARIRSLVERYRDATWIDSEIAAVAGVTQSTISRIRAGGGASLDIARHLCAAGGLELAASPLFAIGSNRATSTNRRADRSRGRAG